MSGAAASGSPCRRRTRLRVLLHLVQSVSSCLPFGAKASLQSLLLLQAVRRRRRIFRRGRLGPPRTICAQTRTEEVTGWASWATFCLTLEVELSQFQRQVSGVDPRRRAQDVGQRVPSSGAPRGGKVQHRLHLRHLWSPGRCSRGAQRR